MSKERRHHASKHYKKPIIDNVKNRMIDTENPSEKDMTVIEELCKEWWNGFKNPSVIQTIIDNLNKCKNNDEKELVLKPVFWHVADKSRAFKKNVSRALFTYNFILGQHFLEQWIAEEKRASKDSINSMIEIDILNLFGSFKEFKENVIYKKLEDYRTYDVEFAIERLLKKGAIVRKPLTKWNEKYFELIAKYDYIGWYIP